MRISVAVVDVCFAILRVPKFSLERRLPVYCWRGLTESLFMSVTDLTYP